MSKRILVVEDQEDNRQILRDLLGSAGYEMTEAWDGEASVSAAKEQRPDLILMDIQLPLMDGYEATRRIKADPELKNIPIIAVTRQSACGRLRRLRHETLQPARSLGKNPSASVLDRRSFAAVRESAFGTKRSWRSRSTMSAFGGKADIGRRRFNVRF